MRDVEAVVAKALEAARAASKISYSKIGERDTCGFAWVDVYVDRINCNEAKDLIAAGFKKVTKQNACLFGTLVA